MRSHFFLVISALVLSSCIHSYYVPNSHNVPLLTEKKDARVAIGYYSTSRDLVASIPGFELQGSYAVGKHVGLMGSFLTAGKKIESTYFNARYGDLGLGYYWANPSKHLVLECYGGYGLGFAENGFDNNAISSSNFSKLFIQPSIGFKSRYFEAAFSWRFASIHHGSVHLEGTLPDFETSEFAWLSGQPTYSVSEPAFTLRFGDHNMKAQLQTGWSSSYERYDPRFFTNIGLVVMFPFKKDREDKKQN